MRADDATDDADWLRPSLINGIGALLAAVTIGLTTAFLWHENISAESNEAQSEEMYARVLQDHAERTFDTVDIVLSSLADALPPKAGEHEGPCGGPRTLDLTAAQLGMPFVRSLSLMDRHGRVLASSVAANVGTQVDMTRIALPEEDARDALGSSLPYRDLGNVVGPVPTPAASATHSFIPLVRAVDLPAGRRVFLVAALNPEFFSNAHELILSDPSRRAALLSMSAVMLTGTDNLNLSPGTVAVSSRIFHHFLPRQESGSFVGGGVDGTRVVTAFRLLRKRPVVVVVERVHSAMAAEMRRTEGAALGMCATALLAIAAMVLTGRRGLKGRDLVRSALAQTQRTVARNEKDLRSLVETVHEMIFRTDPAGRVTFVNTRWRESTGRPRADLIQHRLADLCLPDDRAACEAMFCGEPSRVGSVKVRIAGADGRTLTLEVWASAVLDDDGDPTGFAGFAIDVTERESARQALETQLAFTAQLLDISPMPTFVKDTHGRFTTVNRAWLDLMGMSAADTLGRTSSDLYGADGPKHSLQDETLLLSKERVSYENRLHMPGREPRDTVVTKVRFTRADGTPAGIVGTIVDVTEFREAERHIREARDAAEFANSAKSEFVANITHELRTPLQAIIGFSEMGVDQSSNDPDTADMFREIFSGGQRMLTLVNGLLDVSQIRSDISSMTLCTVDLRQLARDTVAACRHKAGLKKQALIFSAADAACDCDVDPSRYQQALKNVIENAMRFSPPGSTIRVDCARASAGAIDVTVRDQGPGIPESELEQVFESFVQSSRTRDGSGGTGLGLTITRKIMSSHGGSVRASNAPDGAGTVVTLRLPETGLVRQRPYESAEDRAPLLLATGESR